METIEAIKSRRSIRKFKDNNIPNELLEKVIQAASFAPSWKNTQITRYIAIENKEVMERIAATDVPDFNRKIIRNAPLLLALAVVKNRSGYERDGSFSTSKGSGWEMFDCGIAAQTLCLSAQEYGLGTVILGVFDHQEVSTILNIPKDQDLVAMIAIGYPDEAPVMPKRKEIQDIMRIL
jgi:nitroreductase